MSGNIGSNGSDIGGDIGGDIGSGTDGEKETVDSQRQ